MRISQLLLRDSQGGAETLAISLDECFRERGHSSRLTFLDTDANVTSSRLVRLISLRRRLKQSTPDVVIAHSALPSIYARLATFNLPIKVICVLHSARDDFQDATLAFAELFLVPAAVVAVSQTQYENYRKRFPKRESKLHLIPNGIGVSFLPAPRPPSASQFICVSRIAEQKDILTLIRGFSTYVRSHPSARLTILGEWNDDAYSRQVFELADAEPAISFLGRVTDVAHALTQADILIHAAIAEAHSLALAEAQAVALPAVVANYAGYNPPEGVITFEPGNESDLVRALKEAVDKYADLTKKALVASAGVSRITTTAEAYLKLASQVVR